MCRNSLRAFPCRWPLVTVVMVLAGAVLMPVAGAVADETGLDGAGDVRSAGPGSAEAEVAVGTVGSTRVEPEVAGQGLVSGMIEEASGVLTELAVVRSAEGAPAGVAEVAVTADTAEQAAAEQAVQTEVAELAVAVEPAAAAAPVPAGIAGDPWVEAGRVEGAETAASAAAGAPVPAGIAGDPWVEAGRVDGVEAAAPAEAAVGTTPAEQAAGSQSDAPSAVAVDPMEGIAATEPVAEDAAADSPAAAAEPTGGVAAAAPGALVADGEGRTPSGLPVPGAVVSELTALAAKQAAAPELASELGPVVTTRAEGQDGPLVPHERVPGLLVPPGLESARAVDITNAQAMVDGLKKCADLYIDLLVTVNDLDAAVAGTGCAALSAVGASLRSALGLTEGPDRFVVQGDVDDLAQWWTCERGGAGCQPFDPGSFPVSVVDPKANPTNAHFSLQPARELIDIAFTDNPKWWPVRYQRSNNYEYFAWVRRGLTWDGCAVAVDGIRHCISRQVVPFDGAATYFARNTIHYHDATGPTDPTLVRHERRHVTQQGLVGDDAVGSWLDSILNSQLPWVGEALTGGPSKCLSPAEMGAGANYTLRRLCVPYWDEVKWSDGRPILDVRPSRFDREVPWIAWCTGRPKWC